MINGERQTKAAIRWGMVGGGRGSQIGYIHRSAAERDRYFQMTAGAFDLDAARGRAFGVELGLDPDRCYGDYKAMFAAESARPDGIRAVSIATPNNTHYEISKAALLAGSHVICEKPLTFTTAEAEELGRIATERGRAVRPDVKLGICGEHGGDPASIEFCERIGLDYVSCSPFRVPIARLAAAQAAVGGIEKDR